jgi:hypothetical protein
MAHEARWKDEEAVRLLVEANADINCQIKVSVCLDYVQSNSFHGYSKS